MDNDDDDDALDVDYDIDFEDFEEHPFIPEEDPVINYTNKRKTFEWTNQRTTKKQQNQEEFVNPFQNGRFTVDLKQIHSPKDAFLQFMDPELLDQICKFTNAEAAAANFPDFKPVTQETLLAWMAILINAGRAKANHINAQELWSTDPVNSTIFYRAVMSWKTYTAIFRFIRFDHSVSRRTPVQYKAHTNPRTPQPTVVDRLQLIRTVTDRLKQNFFEKFEPGRDVTVDERMVKYRGRCKFIVYMKNKPDPYGMKIWAAADSKTSYFLNFDVYSGKIDGVVETGQGQRVVLQMVEPYFYTKRRVFFDNFFTSIKLALELLEKGLTSTGTLRANKNEIPEAFLIPKGKTADKRCKGSTMYGYHDDMMIMSWIGDSGKNILMLTTDPESYSEATINNKENTKPTQKIAPPNKPPTKRHHSKLRMPMKAKTKKNKLPKPKVIQLYNAYKGGVDRVDQCTKTYSCQRMTRRWTLAFFMNAIDLCVHNAFIMFTTAHPNWQKNSNRKKPLFLTWLAKDLAIDHVRERQKVSSLQNDIKQMIGIFIQDFETNYGPATSPTASCKYCPSTNLLQKCEGCHEIMCDKHAQVEKLIFCINCKTNKVTSSILQTKRGRCYICCAKGGRFKDKKTTTVCRSCCKIACESHREIVSRVVCCSCH